MACQKCPAINLSSQPFCLFASASVNPDRFAEALLYLPDAQLLDEGEKPVNRPAMIKAATAIINAAAIVKISFLPAIT
jgi:hypothetical protein